MSKLLAKGWMALPIAALVLAVLGGVLLARGQLALGNATATVSIGSGEGGQGTQVTVPLEVLSVTDPLLGAVTVEIAYDASLDPAKYDKTASPLDTVVCNLNSAPISCTGISAEGVSGDVLVANITFDLVGSPGECGDLNLEIITFADPDGAAIPANPQDGQICIECEDGDEDGDNVCDGVDDCPGTASGAIVDDIGCSAEQVDEDADEVCDPGAPAATTWCDGSDNCPTVPNPDQDDLDGDGLGDACDDDDDNDGLTNDEEIACGSDPEDADSTCEVCDGVDNDLNGEIDEGFDDTDSDGIADCVDTEECDGLDNDGDGAIDEGFPDTDGDGTADCVDTDDDNDGVDDDDDNCPDVYNPDQLDTDGDGIGDACDDDDDNDDLTDAQEITCGSDPEDADSTCEVCDGEDNDLDGDVDEGFPDTDGDGTADCVDPDDDNDGVLDDDDNCPLVANPDQLDTDGNGVGDACQGDEDGDTVPNADDNCPLVANPDQADLDGDGEGDACDDDDDGDGASDAMENFYGSDPKDADSTPEALGYDQAFGATTCDDDVDNDGDGTMDENEADGPDPDDEADCGVAALPGVAMLAGWNDKCYIGDEMDVQDALSGIADKVLAIYILNQSQTFDHWFPSRSDINTIDTLQPYDQLFVLMSAAGTWSQTPSTETQPSVSLIGGWNSICYTGQTKAIEEATSEIAEAIGILYKFLDATQNWARYVPDNANVSNISTLTELDSVFLLITQEGGITWVFDP